jgi:ACR3 family arsenite transporter
MMEKNKNTGIGFFERYVTVLVILCMVVGVIIGKYLPSIPAFLGRFEYANVSIPIAVLIWVMIYPMMLKVDFASIKNVGKNPKRTVEHFLFFSRCVRKSMGTAFSGILGFSLKNGTPFFQEAPY